MDDQQCRKLSVEEFASKLETQFLLKCAEEEPDGSSKSPSLSFSKAPRAFDEKCVLSEEELISSIASFVLAAQRKADKTIPYSIDHVVHEKNEMETALAGLTSHLARLDNQTIRYLTMRMVNETSSWLSSAFKYPKSKAFFHLKDTEGLISACRMALHKQYPRFALKGFQIWLPTSSGGEDSMNSTLTTSDGAASAASVAHSDTTASVSSGVEEVGSTGGTQVEETDLLPVIYISQCTAPGWADSCLRQLGLPSECLFTLKCNNSEPVSQSSKGMPSDIIDVEYFQRAVEEHLSARRKPLFLLAHAGTWLMGQTDRISALSAICMKHGIWLHVVGSNLAALAISGAIPESVSVIAKVADSFTLQPREWLGISMAPRVTLYKDTDPALASPAGITVDYDQTDLHVLPLWANMQLMGPEKLSGILHANANLSQQFAYKISNIENIFCISQLGSVSSVVLFQFTYKAEEFQSLEKAGKLSYEVINASSDSDVAKQNAINVWIYRMLKSSNPSVLLELVQLLPYSMCLRFSPNVSAALRKTTSEDVNEIAQAIKKLVASVFETDSKRTEVEKQLEAAFVSCKSSHQCARMVSDLDWAGLGVLRYVPEYCEKPVIEGIVVPDQEERAIEEIERLNKLLCKQMNELFPDLKIINGKIGKYWGIKVAMVPGSFDAEVFVKEFLAAGKKLEDPSLFIAGLGSVVESMIRAAHEQLQEEQSSQFWQEGLIRHLPLVGGLYSWILPPAVAPIKGRSFNLSSGSLESTEFVYEHKLQYQEAGEESKGAADDNKEVDNKGDKIEEKH